ncbi:hypothetical protein BDF19DRAFT_437289 [Syncephalis fuscata]|nr:hypothetical protein BDF19DRAFT_437289 [Syncephalis fuscata]
MPIINYNDPRYTEWMNSNIQALGARIHLLVSGVQTQIITHMVVLCIFARNFIVAGKMVISRSRSIASWCCLVPSVSGIMSVLLAILMYLNLGINCRAMVWFFIFNVSLTMLVYLILCRKKWILYIGIPAMMAQLAFVFITIYDSFIVLEEGLGCMTYYPEFILWYWFSVNVPINVIFSTIFCRAALKQYRIFGAKSWKKLASDGIQAMSLATLCNIIGPIITIVSKGKINSDLFFIVDW